MTNSNKGKCYSEEFKQQMTLNKYTTSKSYNFGTITQSHIEYAKDKFNKEYNWFTDFIDKGV